MKKNLMVVTIFFFLLIFSLMPALSTEKELTNRYMLHQGEYLTYNKDMQDVKVNTVFKIDTKTGDVWMLETLGGKRIKTGWLKIGTFEFGTFNKSLDKKLNR